MLKYWIWLATRKGLSARSIYLVASSFPSPKAAYDAPEAAYHEIEGLHSVRPLLDKDLSGAEAILRRCYEKNIQILTIGDKAYPSRLRTISDAPVVLYYRGTLPDLNKPSVAVIGTREASVYGMSQAKKLAFGLAKCGCAVISGGASGVDTEATRGALLGGGTAIVVLGGGVDVVYPRENKQLFQDVAKRGCLLSEYPPGTRPYRANFPQRNRIMSAMSLGVLITQAPARSGALITANHALEQGRDVFVLPANVDVDGFEGNMKLLREGAIPVATAWDIVSEYAPQYPHILKMQEVSMPKEEPAAAPAEKKVIDKPKPTAYIDLKEKMNTLTEDEKLVAELLQHGAMHIDDLVPKTGKAANVILSVLTMLEIKGILRRPSAGIYELTEK